MNATTPGPVVDVQFALRGQAVPEDYADALWCAVRGALPWLEADPLAGIHPLAGLSPGEHAWYLSRRSRLTLRVAREQVAAVQALAGATLALGNDQIEIGAGVVRELLYMPVLYAKFVAIGPAADAPVAEDEFYAACQRELAALDMAPRLICGKPQRARTPAGLLSGFSLMLIGLEADHNQRLQKYGIGGERKRGCGIFVPHKSIAAVGTLE